MPRYIGAYRGGVRPSAPTTVYRTCALSLPCHSEPVTDVTGVGIRSPFHANQRPLAATYLCRSAAKARFDNRPPLPEGVSKEGGPQPSLFGRFKGKRFLRKGGNRNPSPLKWRFWLLLSLLTKVTRRRQNKKGERKKGEIKIPRFLNCSLVTLFRGKSIPPGAKKGKHFGRMWASAPTNV